MAKILRRTAAALAAVVCLVLLAPAYAAPPRSDAQKTKAAKPAKAGYTKPEPTLFLRLQRDKDGQATALQTATVRYVPASNEKALYVDLIGVVHVGDKAYYRKLNKSFEEYDVLLYELVAPKGTRIPKGGRKGSLMAGIVKNLLRLDSQVQRIDYTKKNFVHADMSPKEMAAAMKKRGDDGLTTVINVFLDLMREQNKQLAAARRSGKKVKVPDIDLTTILFDPNGALKIKRFMANQLASTGTSGLGSTLNTMLITDRNKAAMKVLDKQIKQGRKKIGIFYGAAHMPDFEKRLLTEFGLKKKKVQWLTAWDMED